MPRLEVSRTLHDDPVELHYEDHGSGLPIVLIHGWPLSGRSWEPQVAPLVDAGHRVITYDRRGFGQSTHADEGYEYDTLAADLDRLLNRLDLHEATLVGFSMGGGEVVRYLSTFGSERIARAVLASAVPPYLAKTDANPNGALDEDTKQQFQQAILADRPAFLEGFVDDFFGAEGTSTVSDAQKRFAWSLASLASPKATHDCVTAFATTDFRNDLGKIDVPLLVVHGSADGIVPFEASGARVKDFTRDAPEVVLVDGGPHGLNVSHAQEFNQALLDFVGSGEKEATA